MHLSFRWLSDHLYRAPNAGSVLIILDCSYSGNFASIVSDPLQIDLRTFVERNRSTNTLPSQLTNSRMVLAGTDTNQVAYERDNRGSLSGLIVAALRGEAEEALNDHRQVTIQGLNSYLSSQLPSQFRFVGNLTKLIILADYSGSPDERSQSQRGIERESRLQALLHDHSSFIADRLTSFVGRESELAEIRQHISELLPTGGYLIITGEPGQGKSSMIAKLVEEYGSANVAHHFMPFNPDPDHQVALLRSLMARLILKHDLPDIYVASDSRPALRDYFSNLLSEISAKGGQEVIFIDGLDQLEKDSNRVRDLSFLPTSPPPGIVFVLGTRPDDTLRPLQLLKPLYEYKLPSVSRADINRSSSRRKTQIEKLSIFLASPSDVRRERALVREVIEEINRTVAPGKGVVLDLVSSERAIPEYGKAGQAIINEQIGDIQKHDLFVGVMWNRIGTPTPRDISSTAEELARAINALQRRKKPQIWFYFREARANFTTQEELAQRAGVLELRERLRGKSLFHEYTTPQSFAKKFRKHLISWLDVRDSNVSDTQVPTKAGSQSPKETNKTTSSTTRPSSAVKDPHAWIMLDEHFYQAKSAIVQADRSIVLRIASTIGEQIADLRALQGGDLQRRREVSYADRHEAGTTQVQSVVSETSQGKTSFTVTLAPLPQLNTSGVQSEFSFNTYSADVIAELRARLILLGQPLPKELEHVAASYQMRSGYSTPMASSIHSLPQLWASLHTQSRLFLPQAWIYVAYLLKTGNIVESILTLELGPIKDKKMHVKFRGRRAQVYANREPVTIEIDGECVLDS